MKTLRTLLRLLPLGMTLALGAQHAQAQAQDWQTFETPEKRGAVACPIAPVDGQPYFCFAVICEAPEKPQHWEIAYHGTFLGEGPLPLSIRVDHEAVQTLQMQGTSGGEDQIYRALLDPKAHALLFTRLAQGLSARLTLGEGLAAIDQQVGLRGSRKALGALKEICPPAPAGYLPETPPAEQPPAYTPPAYTPETYSPENPAPEAYTPQAPAPESHAPESYEAAPGAHAAEPAPYVPESPAYQAPAPETYAAPAPETHAQPAPPATGYAGDYALTAAQVTERLIGRALSWGAGGSVAHWTFLPDGTLQGAVEQGGQRRPNNGTWQLQADGQVCWRTDTPGCFQFRQAGSALHVFRSDGGRNLDLGPVSIAAH